MATTTKPVSHFGEALRKARNRANKTLGDVADRLGVSAAFLSDVERGNRQPLAPDKIQVVAGFLEADYTVLAAAAAMDRSEIRVSTQGMSRQRVAAGALMMRGLHDLDDDQLAEIAKQVEQQLNKGK